MLSMEGKPEREIENLGPNVFSPVNLNFWILQGENGIEERVLS